MKIFFEIHSGNTREGPGSFQSTKKAFSYLHKLPDKPKILDVGCGPGKQTLDLASVSNGKITAVDNYQPFLDNLKKRIESLKLEDRISVLNMDMFKLDFNNSEFDLIWSEGSIYIIGLENGLREWKNYLKPGGYFAASHICWLKENPPAELYDFWKDAYPAITDIKTNLSVIENSGYSITNHFTLPYSDWWDNYYKPLIATIDNLEDKYSDQPEALEVIKNERLEIDLFTRYSEYFGYQFFISQLNK